MLQKQNINNAFEKMKIKGRMDPAIMEKYGFKQDDFTNSKESYSPKNLEKNQLPGHVSSTHKQQMKNTIDAAYAPYTHNT